MRRLTTVAALSLAFATDSVSGLDLGAIEMQSALNQPMSATIALTSVQPGELQNITVQLASANAFERAGIERSSALLDLSFTIDESLESPAIKVESTQPIAGPFLSFLLEVNGRQGRLVREYTVLLDPPVFTPPSTSQRYLAAIQSPVAQSGEDDLLVTTPIDRSTMTSEEGLEIGPDGLKDIPGEAPVSLDESTDLLSMDRESLKFDDMRVEIASSTKGVSDNVVFGETVVNNEVTVLAGDTLFEIARDNTLPGTSVQQMMMAILAANESFFINSNINLVKAGATLRMPDAADVRSLTQAEAISMINRQNQLWQVYRSTQRATSATNVAQNITPDTEDETQQTDELSEPIENASLESDTSAIDLSDQARAISENTRQEILDREELRIIAANEPRITVAGGTADENADSDSAARLAEIDRQWQLGREELIAARMRREELGDQASQLQDTVSNFDALISLHQNKVAKLEAQLAETRQATEQRTQNADIATVLVTDPASTPAEAADSIADAETTSETPGSIQAFPYKFKHIAIAFIGGIGLLGVLGFLFFRRKYRSDHAEDFRPEALDRATFKQQSTAMSDTRAASSVTLRNQRNVTNKDDIISLVDVYLAYGLHAQAEELLKRAIKSNPDNQGYASKWLQIWHAQSNDHASQYAANNFHQRLGRASNPEWPTVTATDGELIPDNSLSSSTQAPASTQGYAVSYEPVVTHGVSFSADRVDGSTSIGRDFAQRGKADIMEYEDEPVLVKESSDTSFTANQNNMELMADMLNPTTVSSAIGGKRSVDSPRVDKTDTVADEMLDDELGLDIDSTMSLEELDTMLALAKAYIDIGDIDAASSALAVIVKNGSAGQVTEAEKLLRRIS